MDIYVSLLYQFHSSLFFIASWMGNVISIFLPSLRVAVCRLMLLLFKEHRNGKSSFFLLSPASIESYEYREGIREIWKNIHNLTLPFWFSYCSTCLILKEEETSSCSLFPYLRPYTQQHNDKRWFSSFPLFRSFPSSTAHRLWTCFYFFLKKLKLKKNLEKKNKKAIL